MCVIIHKPTGVPIDYTIIEDAFWANPDGCGYAASTPEGYIRYDKGFFSTFTMLDSLFAFADEMSVALDDMSIIFHYRIGTAGKLNTMNCHPFVVDKKLVFSPKGDNPDRPLLTHNGHISLFPAWFNIDREEFKIFSDTFVLTRDVLAHCDTEMMFRILDNVGFQKFALMMPSGKVKRFGAFTYQYGMHFSNMNWQWSYAKKTSVTKAKTRVAKWAGKPIVTPKPPIKKAQFQTFQPKDWTKKKQGDKAEITTYAPFEQITGDSKPKLWSKEYFEIPDPHCLHRLLDWQFVDGQEVTICLDCGGNLSKYCLHEVVESGYCAICYEPMSDIVLGKDVESCKHEKVETRRYPIKDGIMWVQECQDCLEWLTETVEMTDEAVIAGVESKSLVARG